MVDRQQFTKALMEADARLFWSYGLADEVHFNASPSQGSPPEAPRSPHTSDGECVDPHHHHQRPSRYPSRLPRPTASRAAVARARDSAQGRPTHPSTRPAPEHYATPAYPPAGTGHRPPHYTYPAGGRSGHLESPDPSNSYPPPPLSGHGGGSSGSTTTYPSPHVHPAYPSAYRAATHPYAHPPPPPPHHSQPAYHHHPDPAGNRYAHPAPPPAAGGTGVPAAYPSRPKPSYHYDRFLTVPPPMTVTPEERGRVRSFWTQLPPAEQQRLVRVGRQAVSDAVKKQKRASCSCSLCTRRQAEIEDELPVLYEAYEAHMEMLITAASNKYHSPRSHVMAPAVHRNHHSPAGDVHGPYDDHAPCASCARAERSFYYGLHARPFYCYNSEDEKDPDDDDDDDLDHPYEHDEAACPYYPPAPGAFEYDDDPIETVDAAGLLRFFEDDDNPPPHPGWTPSTQDDAHSEIDPPALKDVQAAYPASDSEARLGRVDLPASSISQGAAPMANSEEARNLTYLGPPRPESGLAATPPEDGGSLRRFLFNASYVGRSNAQSLYQSRPYEAAPQPSAPVPATPPADPPISEAERQEILHVAEDLLQNNGEKFLAMMEQFAEHKLHRAAAARRQRETSEEPTTEEEPGEGTASPPLLDFSLLRMDGEDGPDSARSSAYAATQTMFQSLSAEKKRHISQVMTELVGSYLEDDPERNLAATTADDPSPSLPPPESGVTGADPTADPMSYADNLPEGYAPLWHDAYGPDAHAASLAAQYAPLPRDYGRNGDVVLEADLGYGPGYPDDPPYDDDPDDDDDDDDEGELDEEDHGDDPDECDVLASREQRAEEARQCVELLITRLLEQRVILAYREQVAEAKAAELLRELGHEEKKNHSRSQGGSGANVPSSHTTDRAKDNRKGGKGKGKAKGKSQRELQLEKEQRAKEAKREALEARLAKDAALERQRANERKEREAAVRRVQEEQALQRLQKLRDQNPELRLKKEAAAQGHRRDTDKSTKANTETTAADALPTEKSRTAKAINASKAGRSVATRKPTDEAKPAPTKPATDPRSPAGRKGRDVTLASTSRPTAMSVSQVVAAPAGRKPSPNASPAVAKPIRSAEKAPVYSKQDPAANPTIEKPERTTEKASAVTSPASGAARTTKAGVAHPVVIKTPPHPKLAQASVPEPITVSAAPTKTASPSQTAPSSVAAPSRPSATPGEGTMPTPALPLTSETPAAYTNVQAHTGISVPTTPFHDLFPTPGIPIGPRRTIGPSGLYSMSNDGGLMLGMSAPAQPVPTIHPGLFTSGVGGGGAWGGIGRGAPVPPSPLAHADGFQLVGHRSTSHPSDLPSRLVEDLLDDDGADLLGPPSALEANITARPPALLGRPPRGGRSGSMTTLSPLKTFDYTSSSIWSPSAPVTPASATGFSYGAMASPRGGETMAYRSTSNGGPYRSTDFSTRPSPLETPTATAFHFGAAGRATSRTPSLPADVLAQLGLSEESSGPRPSPLTVATTAAATATPARTFTEASPPALAPQPAMAASAAEDLGPIRRPPPAGTPPSPPRYNPDARLESLRLVYVQLEIHRCGNNTGAVAKVIDRFKGASNGTTAAQRSQPASPPSPTESGRRAATVLDSLANLDPQFYVLPHLYRAYQAVTRDTTTPLAELATLMCGTDVTAPDFPLSAAPPHVLGRDMFVRLGQPLHSGQFVYRLKDEKPFTSASGGGGNGNQKSAALAAVDWEQALTVCFIPL
ncbi:Stress response protein nst1 [Tieghemiomyces parasiticus]|uniref:Stress response protein NST1 n=1 Tax=Tieghemiomyces parasiticus TaxID=78921 RepID=A0A9W8AMH8_9FUNG|nr:Stress response protein nst1 [Tieghemiomyces parasiticus]